MAAKLVAISSVIIFLASLSENAKADGLGLSESVVVGYDFVGETNDTTTFDSALSDAYSENFSASLNFYGSDSSSFETTRFEAQMSYQELFSSAVDGDFSKSVLMANIYHDFGRYNKLSPYVGLGTGVSYLQIEGDGQASNIVSESEALASYQMMAGMQYKLSDDSDDSLHLGYRYSSNFGDRTLINDVSSYDDEMHFIQASVNFSF